MKNKRYTAVFIAALLAMLTLFAGAVFVADPYYQYHEPWGGQPVRLVNGRYQNAGVARSFKYDTILMGTSIAANFSADQFDRLFDAKTAKLIVLDGYFSDFKASLDIAFGTHSVKRVIWGIDSNILARGEEGRSTNLPDYLYNDSRLDDIKYLLNKDMFFGDLAEVVYMAVSGEKGGMDTAYTWEPGMGWSKTAALRGYPRPAPAKTETERDAYFADAESNLAVILGYVDAHPETEFTLFLCPYSMLFWDKMTRLRQVDAVLDMQRHILPELCGRSNVRLYYFMDSYDIIGNLENYADSVHFSPEINALLAERMATDKPETADALLERIDMFEIYVKGFDYEALLK